MLILRVFEKLAKWVEEIVEASDFLSPIFPPPGSSPRWSKRKNWVPLGWLSGFSSVFSLQDYKLQYLQQESETTGHARDLGILEICGIGKEQVGG